MKFRSRARNGVGFGAYSLEHLLNADSVPLRMNLPNEHQTDYNMIWVDWNPISEWSDTGGDDVVYY